VEFGQADGSRDEEHKEHCNSVRFDHKLMRQSALPVHVYPEITS
jgi:hypothetical protein